MPIPYMGSKATIAEKLMTEMCLANPQADTFIDLFGGGGAMSEVALKRPQFTRVVYNELNTGIANLMRKIQQDGITPEFYQWVSREEFHDMKGGDCWRSGLIKTCWSFGNNQRCYMYGADVEAYKKAYHDLVVDGTDTRDFMQRYAERYVLEKHGLEQPCVINMPTEVDVQKRRLQVRKDLTGYEKQCKAEHLRRLQQLQHLERLGHLRDLENLGRLQHLERLQQLQHLENLGRLQHLQRLERLDHLRGLEHLERSKRLETLTGLDRLEVFNLNAFEFDLGGYDADKTVIYLDPPYAGTAVYQAKMQASIDHFTSSGFTVYLSEYQNPNPDVWQEVFAVEKRVTMSATNNTNKKVERLFRNKGDK